MASQETKAQTQSRLRDFVSGLVAGVISVTVCNPLDIARTRLNAMNSPNKAIQNNKYKGSWHAIQLIWKQQGFRGFYTGYKINLQAIPLFHSLFFPIYEGMKQWCRNRGYSNNQKYLISTIVAGGFCNIITNPIWVVRTRIMVQFLHPEEKHYKNDSILSIMKQMVKEQGPGSLMKGLSANILGVSNAVIYFFIYQNLKKSVVNIKNKDFTTFYVFFSSIVAKAIASTITYPFVVIRTIMHDHRAESDLGFKAISQHIYKQKGFSGFYAGLKPDLVRLLPSNTIVFVVYQFMKRKWK